MRCGVMSCGLALRLNAHEKSPDPDVQDLASFVIALRAACLGAALLALAGCGAAAPVTYDLSAPAAAARGRLAGALAINEPTAILPVDSDRIVIRTGGESVAYLSGAQWSDRLPRLVQARLIETFERSGHLGRVGRPGLAASYALVTELRRFEIDVARNEAIVEISAKIVSDGAARIVAAQIFSTTSPAPTTQGGQAAVALDDALGQVMTRIVAWSAARI